MRILSITTIIALLSFSLSMFANTNNLDAKSFVDRYTYIDNVEKESQANPLNVVINVKFAKTTITVKQAIEQLLKQSGYKLSLNANVEQINNFTLPKVHRQLGPIPLNRAIQVLLGKSYSFNINEHSREIAIVNGFDFNNSINTHTYTNVMFKEDIKNNAKLGAISTYIQKQDLLKKAVSINIVDTKLVTALNKIIPNGWNVRVDDNILKSKVVSVTAENTNRKKVILDILKQLDASGYFYRELKLLVVKYNKTIIK